MGSKASAFCGDGKPQAVSKVASKAQDKAQDKAQLPVDLPVEDLLEKGGGAWNMDGKVNWKRSSVAEFQGRPALKMVFEKNSGTSSDPGVGGMLFEAVPDGMGSSRAAIAFDVFFEDGWHFSKGGKLMGGFFVGEGNASGYRHCETASSHRIMWQRDGGVISYVYPPAGLRQEDPKLKDSGHGIGYFGDVFPAGTLKVGRWNSLVLGLKMNTFTNGQPNPDGVAYLEVNGRSAAKKDIRWSRSPDLAISKLDLNTFFGGPDPAVKDCVAYVRNFKMVPWPR